MHMQCPPLLTAVTDGTGTIQHSQGELPSSILLTTKAPISLRIVLHLRMYIVLFKMSSYIAR